MSCTKVHLFGGLPVYEIGDPVADAVIEIRNALQKINPEAAEESIGLQTPTQQECLLIPSHRNLPEYRP